MERVKNGITSQFKDAIDNGESISFATNTERGRREYVTVYFAKNVFYKIEFVSEDFSPKFSYFDDLSEKWVGRYPEYGIKDVDKPSCTIRTTEIFMKGKEVSDGNTDCCLYLYFSIDTMTKETTFKNHLIYVESKNYEDYR